MATKGAPTRISANMDVVTDTEHHRVMVQMYAGAIGTLAGHLYAHFVGYDMREAFVRVYTEHDQPLTLRGVSYDVDLTLYQRDGDWVTTSNYDAQGACPYIRDFTIRTEKNSVSRRDWRDTIPSDSARATLYGMVKLAAQTAVQAYPDGWRQARLAYLQVFSRQLAERRDALAAEVAALDHDHLMVARAFSRTNAETPGTPPTEWLATGVPETRPQWKPERSYR